LISVDGALAALARLTPPRCAVNQAIRQMGPVLGVAATVDIVGHTAVSLADFQRLYAAHVGLALYKALTCLRVDTP
jgi:hypothetical protein